MGKLAAVWTRDTMSADGAMVAISQATAVFCIQVPILDTALATQRARKTGL